MTLKESLLNQMKDPAFAAEYESPEIQAEIAFDRLKYLFQAEHGARPKNFFRKMIWQGRYLDHLQSFLDAIQVVVALTNDAKLLSMCKELSKKIQAEIKP